MNTNPDAIKVLCYGDSNTWGQMPDRRERFAADVRWTGRLQQLLGDEYYVVEEGLNSRTTDLDYQWRLGRNGKTYLLPCLATHNPIDIVILMLGSNDLKVGYNRTATDIAEAVGGLVDDIREYGSDKAGEAPRIILVSPIFVNDKVDGFFDYFNNVFDSSATPTSHQFAAAIAEVAKQKSCDFADAASVAEPGEDGLHLTEGSHVSLAQLMRDSIVRI